MASGGGLPPRMTADKLEAIALMTEACDRSALLAAGILRELCPDLPVPRPFTATGMQDELRAWAAWIREHAPPGA